jgi:hypothetical protein
VRCAWRLLDVPSAAEAFEDQAALDQLVDGRLVAPLVSGLVLGRLVPRQPDRGEVGELACSDLGGGAVVEVLDPDQEPPARRAGEQPRQHGSAQVADV